MHLWSGSSSSSSGTAATTSYSLFRRYELWVEAEVTDEVLLSSCFPPVGGCGSDGQRPGEAYGSACGLFMSTFVPSAKCQRIKPYISIRVYFKLPIYPLLCLVLIMFPLCSNKGSLTLTDWGSGSRKLKPSASHKTRHMLDYVRNTFHNRRRKTLNALFVELLLQTVTDTHMSFYNLRARWMIPVEHHSNCWLSLVIFSFSALLYTTGTGCLVMVSCQLALIRV